MYNVHIVRISFYNIFSFVFVTCFIIIFHGEFTSTQHIGDAGEQGAPAVQGEAAGGLPAGQGAR